jgi:hypothetical protein
MNTERFRLGPTRSVGRSLVSPPANSVILVNGPLIVFVPDCQSQSITCLFRVQDANGLDVAIGASLLEITTCREGIFFRSQHQACQSAVIFLSDGLDRSGCLWETGIV